MDILAIAVATLVHNTAIVAIPIYLVALKVTRATRAPSRGELLKYAFITVACFVLAITSIDAIFGLLGINKYVSHLDLELMPLWSGWSVAIIVIIAFLLFDKIIRTREHLLLVYFSLTSCAVSLIGLSIPFADRLSWYLTPYIYILLSYFPMAVKGGQSRRRTVIGLICCIALLFFRTQYVQNVQGIFPYNYRPIGESR